MDFSHHPLNGIYNWKDIAIMIDAVTNREGPEVFRPPPAKQARIGCRPMPTKKEEAADRFLSNFS